ncbi:MAG: hypothetical protein AB1611_16585 [bacterium]
MALTDQEKEELVRQSQSSRLKEDMRQLAAKAYDPFMVDGQIDADRWLAFLNGYNEFVGHTRKPLKWIVERVMKL